MSDLTNQLNVCCFHAQAYPTPVFAAPVVDAFEGVTHALLTTDDDDLFYTWVQRSLNMLPIVARYAMHFASACYQCLLQW